MEEQEPPGKRNPAASFTDDILIQILSRLPIRSVCRFKCVSWPWRNLINHPEHRKKLPQTLVGFFYSSWNAERFPYKARHFTNVTGKGPPFIKPSLSFLPDSSSDITILDCCNGLLLLCCYQPGPQIHGNSQLFHYIVCNPATENWAMLPDGSWASGDGMARTEFLCFDPTASPHFSVIVYVVEEGHYVAWVEIYSSETGSWSAVESGWDDELTLCDDRTSVFLNGFLHSVTLSDEIVAVDKEGKTWRTIPTPPNSEFGFIHRAQSQLCFININDDDCFKLNIWTLEDYGTDNWILKHTVSTPRLFGGKRIQFDIDYKVIAIHPEGNAIFFVYGWDNTLMAYIMDRREVRVIRNLGHDCAGPYLSYVPLFSKSLLDGQ